MREKITIYLEPEQVEAIDRIRGMSIRPRDRNKEIRGLLWLALMQDPTSIGKSAWEKFCERTEK